MNLRWFQKGNSSAVVVTAPLLVPALLAIFSVALIVSRSYKVRPGGVLGPTVWWLAGCAHFSRLLYAVYEHPGSLVSDLRAFRICLVRGRFPALSTVRLKSVRGPASLPGAPQPLHLHLVFFDQSPCLLKNRRQKLIQQNNKTNNKVWNTYSFAHG